MSFKLSWCLPRRHRLMVLLLICLLLLAAWAIWIIKAYSEQQVKKSILQLERRSYFVLYANGEPLLTFSEFTPDSVMAGLSFSEDSVKRTLFTAGGFWVNRHVAFPSCNGRVMAVVSKLGEVIPTPNNAKLFLRKEISYLTADLKARSEEHTSELQSRQYLVCRLLLEKKNNIELHYQYDRHHTLYT